MTRFAQDTNHRLREIVHVCADRGIEFDRIHIVMTSRWFQRAKRGGFHEEWAGICVDVVDSEKLAMAVEIL